MRLIEDSIDLSAYLEEPNPGARVIPASSVFDRVIEDFMNPSLNKGARTPWPNLDPMIRFREAEISLWAGLNNTGKSLITSQVAMALCAQGERVCIASFEMPPWKTMRRMTRQASGGAEPAMSFMKAFRDWTDNKLWIFNHVGSVTPAKVYAVMRYCADKHGVTHFFIDSLMRCVKGEDDYNGQKDFVVGLCDVVQSTKQHAHLVHHMKKPEDESRKPNRFDARGGAGISDNVDNVLLIWRNKPKERSLQFCADEQERQELEEKPDVLLICDKQREGDWEGSARLWYNTKSLTFRTDGRTPWTSGIELGAERAYG